MFSLERIKICSRVKSLQKRGLKVKVHAGCGGHYLVGWINIDRSRKSRSDFKVDLTKRLPFQDNSVDYIFNEHVIEHLKYEEGLFFLQECWRILKPSGILRTAFPDLDKLIETYLHNSWEELEWVKKTQKQPLPSGCFLFNLALREKGHHHYLYSIKELKERLIAAGFTKENICVCSVGKSQVLDLSNLERRADSSVLEARKS